MHPWKTARQPEKTRWSRLRGVLLTTAVIAGLTACAPSKQPWRHADDTHAALREKLNLQPAKWPLKFKRHTFTAVCYSTQICRVSYAGAWSGSRKPSVASSEYGPKYLDHILGGHVGIANFPDPAEVTWRSMDGTEHQARIDIGAIFRDELVRHNAPREDVRELVDGQLSGNPLILLEINDRTIRLYMRALIPTKTYRVPGNPYTRNRDDLILAKTYQY